MRAQTGRCQKRFSCVIRVLSAAAALSAAVIMVAASFAVRCPAAPYEWDGGHDTRGWPEPATKAYFAEGTTRNGFEEYLIVRNPGSAEGTVSVDYLFPPPEVAQQRRVTLAPGAGVSICVNDDVGNGKDVSIRLTSDVGVICERQIYFNYQGVWTGGHISSGVAAPCNTWYFAEGTTRNGFDEWLCLQNPSADQVEVKLTFMLGTSGNLEKTIVLGANSRHTVGVRDAVGAGQDVSVVVEAQGPIVAERPMYFDYNGSIRGGHNTAGSTELASQWFFAEGTTREGFEEWLCVLNPGEGTFAEVDYLFPDGLSVTKGYWLAGRARTTIPVNAEAGPGRDVSLRVTAGEPVLCERPMYFRYHGALEGGHVVVGSTGGSTTWQFPTAALGEGFESWLCLANTYSGRNNVIIEVIGDDGASGSRLLQMEPSSRATLSLNEEADGMLGPWVRVTGEEALVVERPTYFSYEPKTEPDPFAFALFGGAQLLCPIRYCDLLGNVFHESSTTAGDGKPNNAQVLQPLGECLVDDNPARRHPGIGLSAGGEAAYFIEETRGRGTYSTTACDVQSKAGAIAYSPVNGTVLAAESYMLYGGYPDMRVKISIDGFPGYQMVLLHMYDLQVTVNQRVEAGHTPVGSVRDLVPYFNSGPNPYTREEGNHVHLQINYRPEG